MAERGMTMTPLTAALMLTVFTIPAAAQPTPLDQGYRHLYNLNFTAAHRAFADWEKTHPDDPMGAVSDAAVYLFAEFDRLHVLQSEFFTDDNGFLRRERSLTPDAAAKRDFQDALERAHRLASATLARAPDDENALLATLLRLGLHSDYVSLIKAQSGRALGNQTEPRNRSAPAGAPSRLLRCIPGGGHRELLAQPQALAASLGAPARRRADGQTDRYRAASHYGR